MIYPAHASEYLAANHQRIALLVSYQGQYYHGWQSQANAISVQQKLEQALSKVANQPIKVVCAGRTDAGVHASAQVVHFDTSVQRSMRSWVYGGNTQMPDDISIQWAHPVTADFHARFSAKSRRYVYVIYTHSIRPALLHNGVTWHYHDLAHNAMQTAAQYLLGTHDFSAFRASACQAHSPIRTLQRFDVIKVGDYIVLDVIANAFLQHMVRNLAGMLMAIGMDKYPPQWAHEVLLSKDRKQNAATASPKGLYFAGAQYANEFDLPSTQQVPHFLQSGLA